MKTRYIPENAETREFPAAALTAYCYDSDRGPAFVAYKGRRTKAAFHFAYSTLERRDEVLNQYVERETYNENIRKIRRLTYHGLKAGDILCSSWGYEQTNVNFYEVIRTPSDSSVVIREIEQSKTPTGDMTGQAVPLPGCFLPLAKEYNRRASDWHTVNGISSSSGILRKWDGRPLSYSSYC